MEEIDKEMSGYTFVKCHEWSSVKTLLSRVYESWSEELWVTACSVSSSVEGGRRLKIEGVDESRSEWGNMVNGFPVDGICIPWSVSNLCLFSSLDQKSR